MWVSWRNVITITHSASIIRVHESAHKSSASSTMLAKSGIKSTAFWRRIAICYVPRCSNWSPAHRSISCKTSRDIWRRNENVHCHVDPMVDSLRWNRVRQPSRHVSPNLSSNCSPQWAKPIHGSFAASSRITTSRRASSTCPVSWISWGIWAFCRLSRFASKAIRCDWDFSILSNAIDISCDSRSHEVRHIATWREWFSNRCRVALTLSIKLARLVYSFVNRCIEFSRWSDQIDCIVQRQQFREMCGQF